VYFFAALPFFFFGLWGWEHGAFLFYAAVGLFSILQMLFQTFFGWSVMFGLYLVHVTMYTYLFTSDVFLGSNDVLVDTDDSVVFIIFYIFILTLFVMLWRVRPR
jgi:hypothetical protein